jgi:hypothetical protein
LIIGITGGARDFPVSPELEQVLNDLIQVARKTEAWLISGGTSGGIMKYIGTLSLNYNTSSLKNSINPRLANFRCDVRSGPISIWRHHPVDWDRAMGRRCE